MDFAYRSDIGQQREENEDYVGVFKNNAGINFAIVADGIGGHQGATSLPKWQCPTWATGLKTLILTNRKTPLNG